MNNLPPGVSNNTYGAPWNEIEFEGKIELDVFVSGVVDSTLPDRDERIKEVLTDISNYISTKLLSLDSVDDVTIISKQIV